MLVATLKFVCGHGELLFGGDKLGQLGLENAEKVSDVNENYHTAIATDLRTV